MNGQSSGLHFFPGNAYYVLPRIASYVFLGIRRLSGVWDRSVRRGASERPE